MKRPLHELGRGDFFRTADRLLWVRASLYPAVGNEMVTCSAVARGAGPSEFKAGLEVEPLDLPALLARLADLEKENRDLRGMVADLWDESRAARLAAEAERGAAAEVIRGEAGRWRDGYEGAAYGEGLRRALDLLKARGPWRPPVPPCALEGAAREAVAVLEALWPVLVNRDLGHSAGEVERALARLRAALGEG